MSVIVKGMDMPKSCLYCPMLNGSDECCLLSDEQNYAYDDIDQVKDNYCPLVALPKKHGRLIDADAFVEYLENEFKTGYENDQKSDADMKMLIAKMHELIITEIHNRPTVIESEG